MFLSGWLMIFMAMFSPSAMFRAQQNHNAPRMNSSHHAGFRSAPEHRAPSYPSATM